METCVCLCQGEGWLFPNTYPPSAPPGSLFTPRNTQNKRTHLDSLDFQLHVILPGGLSVFPLLPTVAILSVLHLLPIVQDHGTILRPGSTESGQRDGESETKTERNMKREDFEGSPAGGLISEVHKER